MFRDRAAGDRRRVVIIGGGFGGVEAARKLKKADVEVTVVDRHNHLLFQPLIYQVAAGALSSGEVAAPLRQLLKRQGNASNKARSWSYAAPETNGDRLLKLLCH